MYRYNPWSDDEPYFDERSFYEMNSYSRNPMTPDGWLVARADITTGDGIPLWHWEIGGLEDQHPELAEIHTKQELRELLQNAIDAAIWSGIPTLGDRLIVTIGDSVTQTTFSAEDLR